MRVKGGSPPVNVPNTEHARFLERFFSIANFLPRSLRRNGAQFLHLLNLSQVQVFFLSLDRWMLESLNCSIFRVFERLNFRTFASLNLSKLTIAEYQSVLISKCRNDTTNDRLTFSFLELYSTPKSIKRLFYLPVFHRNVASTWRYPGKSLIRLSSFAVKAYYHVRICKM